MKKEFSDEELEEINRYISEHTGITYAKARLRELERPLLAACKEASADENEICIETITRQSHKKEFLERLIRHITVGETYFFRDQKVFAYLRDELLYNLIQERRKAGTCFLRIWSAACSSGEEPYSIALLLKYLIPDISSWDIFILATDINEYALQKAREGIYSRWSFRDEPIIPIGKFFTPLPDNRFRLDDSIRSMVRFERMNLIQRTGFINTVHPSSLDLVLCRNVLMYFDHESAESVVSYLVDSLNTGGTLIVSPQEIGIVNHPQVKMFHNGQVFIHVKGTAAKERDFFAAPGRGTIPDSITEIVPVSIEERTELPYHTEPEISVPEPLIARHTPGEGEQVKDPEQTFFTYIQDNRLDEAGHSLIQISGSLKKDDRIRNIETLIRAFAGLGDYEKALGWSERMIAEDPLYARAYLLKAAILEEQGLANDAITTLKQSLFADPDFIPAILAISGLYGKTGRNQDKRHHYELALRILESVPDASVLEDTEGIPAGRLKEMIRLMLGRI